ncbi:MAG: phosphatase [Rhodobacterales bacterium CG18_big_fil_WC_8_21_14_2_50_71_9]|nr:MAG: phosphatase [Rhodobacterales bacterium CG18_big_fil_WC_8_21_14_2_50_71_9]PJA61061.1 MAG: phosphatase [Rhodobacterales bacterium CG_4_9_14_3_um_filter_71_31]
MLEALIFDVDGTLAETEELHRRAFNEAFAAAGLDWTWSQDAYRALLRTTGGKERITRYLTERGADPAAFDVAALHAAKTERYVALMAEGAIALRPGVAALIARARAAGLRLAVATTTSLPNVEALSLAVFGRPADAVFDVIAAGDVVAAKKPAPDIYRHALRALGAAPARAVAFEDSLNGLRAAQGAGLRCVVTPGVYTDTEDFSGADLLLNDLAALDGLEALASLPPR